ncbi:MAG: 23S rRNA (uridine(2552)-2'-O)-methyltransferase RlmE [Gammaproteobacteria bacterium]|nr:23S rRNA (uridine(2552)-2'-O)-methyltransferase RlmE [Gammaproteobacteria bacterium]
MKQSKTSKQWLREHFSDAYVKKAHQHGLRSRAYFKLEELDQKEKLFKSGMTIVDLGSAPGGWSQYLSQKFNEQAKLLALDILPMEHLPGVEFICGDFTEDAVLAELSAKLCPREVDIVISDMAPNWSGCKHIDLPKTMFLAELAADFAMAFLKPGGGFLIKLFQGEGFDAYLKFIREHFSKVSILKPQASRDRSREFYLLAKGFKL